VSGTFSISYSFLDLNGYDLYITGGINVYYSTIEMNGGQVIQGGNPYCWDADGDSYNSMECGGQDCEDLIPLVHPGAIEVCDGADNNCVDGIDEEPLSSFSCDDSSFCNGIEFCNHESNQCVSPGNPCPDDGNSCTDDICNSDLDTCEYSCNAENSRDPCCEDSVCSDHPKCRLGLPWLNLLLDGE